VRDRSATRAICAGLFVSPRTVQTHVSHILPKTGLRSRVTIARCAGPDARRFPGMKPLALILAFGPLIVFSLLARFLPHGYIGVAALAAAVTALIAMAASRPVWPPKILSACSLVLFAVIAVLGFTLGTHDDRWLATWGGAGVGLILGAVILALIPVMPFTEQFARASVPESEWSSPTFKKINRVLSAGWGAAIFFLGVSRVLAAVVKEHTSSRWPELILGLLLPSAILTYMFMFSKSYPKRVTHEPAHAPTSASR
jgi:intracellular septation protein A